MLVDYAYKSMPMRIQARPGSRAEAAYYLKAALPGVKLPRPKAIARGIDPAPLDDLMYHGGKVVPQMEFQNIYLGGSAAWKASDIESIDGAILHAMRHKRLGNVMVQYFPGASVTCDARDSLVVEAPRPKTIEEADAKAQLIALYDAGSIRKTSLASCIFNLVLPQGTELRLDDSTSKDGLGGYHGSIHFKRAGRDITLYYSANVYSEVVNGRENGIAVFNRPWKNVVATLYHEINEFRTDADVDDAITHRSNDFLGWASRDGLEVGDQPIFKAGEAGDLRLVFKEVQDTPRKKRVPVQFLYSNAVHGAEGPIAKPHA